MTEIMWGNAKTKENRTVFVIQPRRFRAILASGFKPIRAIIYLFLILPSTNLPIASSFASRPFRMLVPSSLNLCIFFSPHIPISYAVFPAAYFPAGTFPALCTARDSGFDRHIRLGYPVHKSSLALSSPRLPIFFHQLFEAAIRMWSLYNYILNSLDNVLDPSSFASPWEHLFPESSIALSISFFSKYRSYELKHFNQLGSIEIIVSLISRRDMPTVSRLSRPPCTPFWFHLSVTVISLRSTILLRVAIGPRTLIVPLTIPGVSLLHRV